MFHSGQDFQCQTNHIPQILLLFEMAPSHCSIVPAPKGGAFWCLCHPYPAWCSQPNGQQLCSLIPFKISCGLLLGFQHPRRTAQTKTTPPCIGGGSDKWLVGKWEHSDGQGQQQGQDTPVQCSELLPAATSSLPSCFSAWLLNWEVQLSRSGPESKTGLRAQLLQNFMSSINKWDGWVGDAAGLPLLLQHSPPRAKADLRLHTQRDRRKWTRMWPGAMEWGGGKVEEENCALWSATRGTKTQADPAGKASVQLATYTTQRTKNKQKPFLQGRVTYNSYMANIHIYTYLHIDIHIHWITNKKKINGNKLYNFKIKKIFISSIRKNTRILVPMGRGRNSHTQPACICFGHCATELAWESMVRFLGLPLSQINKKCSLPCAAI